MVLIIKKKIFFIEWNSSYLIQQAIYLNKIILFTFLIINFCLCTVKDVFIYNKFQKLVIFLFNYVYINIQNLITIRKYSLILLIYRIFLFIFSYFFLYLIKKNQFNEKKTM